AATPASLLRIGDTDFVALLDRMPLLWLKVAGALADRVAADEYLRSGEPQCTSRSGMRSGTATSSSSSPMLARSSRRGSDGCARSKQESAPMAASRSCRGTAPARP